MVEGAYIEHRSSNETTRVLETPDRQVPQVKHVKSCWLLPQNTSTKSRTPAFLSHGLSRLTSLVALPGRRPLATRHRLLHRSPTSNLGPTPVANRACRSPATTRPDTTQRGDRLKHSSACQHHITWHTLRSSATLSILKS